MNVGTITRLKFFHNRDLPTLQYEVKQFVFNAQMSTGLGSISGFVFKNVTFHYDPIDEEHYACVVYDSLYDTK